MVYGLYFQCNKRNVAARSLVLCFRVILCVECTTSNALQQCHEIRKNNKKSSEQFFCFFLIPLLDGINRCCVLSVVKISWKRRTIYLRANITKERHNYGRIDLPLIRAAIHNTHTIRFHFSSFNRLMFNSVRIWLH